MTALKLENVNKSFGPVHVLKDINLTVEEGEFVVFVGPSGCGKSTLLRVIAGLEDATSGTVTIGDQVVNAVPPAGIEGVAGRVGSKLAGQAGKTMAVFFHHLWKKRYWSHTWEGIWLT